MPTTKETSPFVLFHPPGLRVKVTLPPDPTGRLFPPGDDYDPWGAVCKDRLKRGRVALPSDFGDLPRRAVENDAHVDLLAAAGGSPVATVEKEGTTVSLILPSLSLKDEDEDGDEEGPIPADEDMQNMFNELWEENECLRVCDQSAILEHVVKNIRLAMRDNVKECDTDEDTEAEELYELQHSRKAPEWVIVLTRPSWMNQRAWEVSCTLVAFRQVQSTNFNIVIASGAMPLALPPPNTAHFFLQSAFLPQPSKRLGEDALEDTLNYQVDSSKKPLGKIMDPVVFKLVQHSRDKLINSTKMDDPRQLGSPKMMGIYPVPKSLPDMPFLMLDDDCSTCPIAVVNHFLSRSTGPLPKVFWQALKIISKATHIVLIYKEGLTRLLVFIKLLESSADERIKPYRSCLDRVHTLGFGAGTLLALLQVAPHDLTHWLCPLRSRLHPTCLTLGYSLMEEVGKQWIASDNVMFHRALQAPVFDPLMDLWPTVREVDVLLDGMLEE